jgi:hypothetical protein
LVTRKEIVHKKNNYLYNLKQMLSKSSIQYQKGQILSIELTRKMTVQMF